MTITADNPLADALNQASRSQIERLATLTGVPARRLYDEWTRHPHATRHLAGWIRREIAEVLRVPEAELFPESHG